MGDRDDNIIDDERADALLRRTLEREVAGYGIAAPPDLVSRTLQHLPPGPPTEAARYMAARRRRRTIIFIGTLTPILLIALVNIWSVAAGGPQMAFLFGDGRTGFSSALLSVHLVVKPLWNTLRFTNAVLVLSAVLVAGVSILILRRLIRRIRDQYEVEEL